ncbi:hypothetical protein Hbl1158_15120 (plasmid) [Halobaculum sp. CBA1158]|uniref:hypothetical protein n=1 Tax=Halobaculum sp. CBA1158 TaxID=2904243 RepID=UPI001F28A50C|nr:hypothetical protein [Halobaculum sp. CBA1158]UIP01466.1 hypothetical protein Hbl1158_15120 [Halobaculum sp. CBA1158]
MTGFAGGVDAGPIAASLPESLLSASLLTDGRYDTRRRAAGDAAVGLVEHADRDPASDLIHGDGDRLGVLYGVISNDRGRDLSPEALFERVLADPGETLRGLEGPFALAAVDAADGRVVIATDKAGSRPCYYATSRGLAFASGLSPLVTTLPDPTVDARAVGNLLAYGAVLGERTVLDGIAALPPATYLAYEADEATATRYWTPSIDDPDQDAGADAAPTGRVAGAIAEVPGLAAALDDCSYVDEWVRRHGTAIGDLSRTVADDLSLFLSGGIDSRVTAAALREAGREFDALTYATGEGGNRANARRVADAVRAPIAEVPVGSGSGEAFVEGVRRSVDAVDAMSSWAYVPALPFAVDGLADAAEVVMEGGTFLGEDVFARYTRRGVPAVETLFRKRSLLSADRVAAIVAEGVDPRESIAAVVDASPESDPARRSAESMRRLYACLHARSTIPLRTRVGTRTVADGRFLEHVLSMPDRYRVDTVPFTEGRVPFAVSPMKLATVRRLAPDLASIPYERTGVAPSRPLWAHVIGAGAGRISPFDSGATPDGYLGRYRTEPIVRSFIDGLIADAAGRPFLDAAALADLRADVGEDRNLIPVAAVAGLELWLQTRVDPNR